MNIPLNKEIHIPRRYWLLSILLLVILMSTSIRVRLAETPLERDEGEYAYGGQLILQGVPPYKQFYSMKLPGIFAFYAGLMAVFGHTHQGIHLGLLVINVATTILIFLLGMRLIDLVAGVVAGACFSLLSLGQAVLGLSANAEHFVIFWAIGGLLVMLWALDDDRDWLLLLSGFFLGICFLMKQHGAAFVAFAGLYILVDGLRKSDVLWPRLISRCAIFSLGVLVAYGLTILILALVGVFDNFWLWTVEYPRAYISEVPLSQAWSNFKTSALPIAGSAPLIWILSGVGWIALVWRKHVRRYSILIGMFVLFSFVAICPGFFFRPHYFLLILPVATLLAGLSISVAVKILSKFKSTNLHYVLPILLAVSCLAVSVYQQRGFLFQMTPAQVSRATYGLNPFPESILVGQLIKNETKKDDTIAVIGSEPQIYFYSDRRAASGHIYMYPLMEDHRFALEMQKNMIREIESAQPEFMVFVSTYTSWLQREDSHGLVLRWFEDYQAQHYSLVGLVDILNKGTLYSWEPNVKWPPRSTSWMTIVRRKN
jgi:hypothetical protein